MHREHRSQRTSGFTLVEVAVALAIFVFGAIAIIRIFPPALGVIQNSGDRTTAVNLNRTTLARFENHSNAIPDATYNDNDGGGIYTFKETAVNGTGSRNKSVPRVNIKGIEDTALGQYRRIVGERHKVLGTSPNQFVLTDFSNLGTINVYIEDSVTGVTINQTGNLDFSDAQLASSGDSFSDSSAPSLPLNSHRYIDGATAGDTIYYVSYRYQENGYIHGVLDEPMIFPADGPGYVAPKVIQGPRLVTLPDQIITGTISVRFRQLAELPIAISPPTPPTDPDLRLLGKVDLLGAYPAGQTISLDYTVADWRWLVSDGAPTYAPDETKTMPGVTYPTTGLAKAVALPIHNVANDEFPQVQALLSEETTPGTFTFYPGIWDGANASGTNFLGFNRKTNQAIFDNVDTMTAPKARVVYQTMDEWAHQLSVAPRSYIECIQSYLTTPREEWREYALTTPAADSFLYFHQSEAGKTLLVSYIYNDGTGDITVNGRLVTIDEDSISKPATLPGDFTGTRVSRCHLVDASGNDIAIKAILQVRGMSVQARTAWLNGGQYTQSTLTTYRGGS